MKRERLSKRLAAFVESRMLRWLPRIVRQFSPRYRLAAAFLADHREHRRRHP